MWIEITNSLSPLLTWLPSQPTRAVWIEIVICKTMPASAAGRSPLGLCGLKSKAGWAYADCYRSQPTRAVWIEIITSRLVRRAGRSRSPLGLCGLKWHIARHKFALPLRRSPLGLCGLKSVLVCCPRHSRHPASQPTRAVWIEIALPVWLQAYQKKVAAHSGCVD